MPTPLGGGVGSNQYESKGASVVQLRPRSDASVAQMIAATHDLVDVELEPWERVPVSAVPFRSGYTMKSCKTKTQNDLDPSMVGLEEEDTPGQILVMERGIEMEAEMFERITAANSRAVTIPDGDRNLRQEMTAAAMKGGAPIILGGFLPDDEQGRRSGKPDVLYRVDDPATGTFGYRAADVKGHTLAADSDKADATLTASEFGNLGQGVTEPGKAFNRSYLEKDAMQLAHYQRMLEAAGFAVPGPAAGGIIDKAGRMWHVDLDDKTWGLKGAKESTMERYDREDGEHMRIARQQLARNEDPDVPRPKPPVRCGDCSTCKWRRACKGEMEAADHVSLLPNMATSKAQALMDAGIATRAQVAAMDPLTARVAAMAPKIDLDTLIPSARQANPTLPVDRLLGRKHKQIENLHEAGIHTAGDLAQLDLNTARLGPGGSAVDNARAAISGRVWRARNAPTDPPPRAAVEIHFDMENNGDGRVYLWGARTHDRDEGNSTYTPIADWEPGMDDRREAQLVAATWQHMGRVISEAAADGKDAQIVLYTSAEASQLRRVAAANEASPNPVPDCPSVAAVNALVESDRWVDAHKEAAARVITGGGLGLKEVAPQAGFNWSDPSTGGEESMVLYEAAVNSSNRAVRETMRRRILTYNAEDTAATAAVMDWLEGPVAGMPSIDTWTP